MDEGRFSTFRLARLFPWVQRSLHSSPSDRRSIETYRQPRSPRLLLRYDSYPLRKLSARRGKTVSWTLHQLHYELLRLVSSSPCCSILRKCPRRPLSLSGRGDQFPSGNNQS